MTKKTIKEWTKRLVTVETFDQSDEETWHDQIYIDKYKDNDTDNDKDKDILRIPP